VRRRSDNRLSRPSNDETTLSTRSTLLASLGLTIAVGPPVVPAVRVRPRPTVRQGVADNGHAKLPHSVTVEDGEGRFVVNVVDESGQPVDRVTADVNCLAESTPE
jgi:hypothetical protein